MSPLNCARHTLELAGFKTLDHLELHKLGIRKGSAPVTDERIASGVASAKKILAGETPPRPNLMCCNTFATLPRLPVETGL